MASIKDLKKRIGSVKNTQQTTKAMKMVSAAKLRRAQDAIYAHRPYAQRMAHLIRLVSSLGEGSAEIPLLARKREPAEGEAKKVLLVVMTSDRGLCGGFNGNVIKGTQKWLADSAMLYGEIQLGFVGRKGYDFFKVRNVTLGQYFSELGGKVSFAKAKKLTDALVQIYLSGQVDEIKFIYNEFKNAASQKVVIEDFLPLNGDMTTEGKPSVADSGMYLVKPGRREVLEMLVEKNFAIQAYRVLLESQASEHGARMSAMENATKNAGEMIRKLTLQYNKQRQAGITKELLEIISGAESQKSS
jgi:F-type H+-transporting ATPase subunit gamma